MYDTKDVAWKGNRLMPLVGGRKAPSVDIIADARWPGMWRVKRPDGTMTDMANHTRARDAAKTILLAVLNARETSIEAPPMRSASQAHRMHA